MTNLDRGPEVTPCHSAAGAGAVAEFHEPRAVPLGGVRGMKVDRVLPQRALPTVGAWCFLDQFGPERVEMKVLPHPHTGLQTVTWPLAGEIRHRDSVGSDVLVRPGQLNLMTAGRGVSHSEFSVREEAETPETPETPLLHALQLWVALPDDALGIEPAFEQHTGLPHHRTGGVDATVLMGSLGDAVSPATTHTPLLGAELAVAAGAEAVLPLRPGFEHAVLVIDGEVEVDGVPVGAGPLLYLGTGRTELGITATAAARVLLLGGEPFPGELVMWWNFVGRGHDEIAAARADWESGTRFGEVDGHDGQRIPAPVLPGVRLTPRRRR
ncbi:pirin family protein [Amycolatopsis magusensis]|uniref:pirin family protein n=1 Tax=Amycolatopsis magusensis TaxID=882444 RepID=UPI0024A803DD|nr:pirin family protein [Amycolatopsis magusensis]MDI5980745.1 pirin family protein [Amycolatopsis magusensis]